MTNLVYFSSVSGNTKRFIEKLGMPAERIPLYPREERLVVDEEFVLVVPTYGGGNGSLIRGVISAGNTNFGEAYCLAGDIISTKCQVPHMYKFELFGTPRDVTRVHDGLEEFWRH